MVQKCLGLCQFDINLKTYLDKVVDELFAGVGAPALEVVVRLGHKAAKVGLVHKLGVQPLLLLLAISIRKCFIQDNDIHKFGMRDDWITKRTISKKILNHEFFMLYFGFLATGTSDSIKLIKKLGLITTL